MLFANDPTSPTTSEQWETAIGGVDDELGLTESLPWRANLILEARP